MSTQSTALGWQRRVLPFAALLVAIISIQFGAAFAKQLFPVLGAERDGEQNEEGEKTGHPLLVVLPTKPANPRTIRPENAKFSLLRCEVSRHLVR